MIGSLIGRFRKKSESYDRDEILNDGLHLAMNANKDKVKPIQNRLGKRYPALSQGELDEYNEECHAAMKYGHDLVFFMAEKTRKHTDREEFQVVYRDKFPWVSDKNTKRLFRQGMYYAPREEGV